MNEAQFRHKAREKGYEDCQFKEYAPNMDGPLHTHEFSVMLLVVSGEFTLAFESGSSIYRPGDCCELAADTVHSERTGAAGARVLLGKKTSPASPSK